MILFEFQKSGCVQILFYLHLHSGTLFVKPLKCSGQIYKQFLIYVLLTFHDINSILQMYIQPCIELPYDMCGLLVRWSLNTEESNVVRSQKSCLHYFRIALGVIPFIISYLMTAQDRSVFSCILCAFQSSYKAIDMKSEISNSQLSQSMSISGTRSNIK